MYFPPNGIWMVKYKQDEMGRVCSKHGRGEKCMQDFKAIIPTTTSIKYHMYKHRYNVAAYVSFSKSHHKTVYGK
jgi:hypothetical protein